LKLIKIKVKKNGNKAKNFIKITNKEHENNITIMCRKFFAFLFVRIET